MTAESIIALIAVVLTLLGAGISAYIALIRRQDSNHNELSGRVTRLETFIEIFGREALKGLHSPDDHLGLDEYIDKITGEYRSHHYDLSDEQWVEFKTRLSEVGNNPKATKLEKVLAGYTLALCEHKLMRVPPELRGKT
jgi:hypothetical protein